MNTNTQIVDDLHVIAAPIRFAGNLIVRLITITLFIALYPLILAWLLYTNHIEHIHATAAPYYYPPTEDGLHKIVICVLGPFAFVVWFSLLARWAEMRRHGGLWQEKEAGFDPTRGNNLRSCLGWLFSVLGACGALMFCSYNWIEGEPTVWAAAIGHLLPAIAYIPYRLLKTLEENGQAGLQHEWGWSKEQTCERLANEIERKERLGEDYSAELQTLQRIHGLL